MAKCYNKRMHKKHTYSQSELKKIDVYSKIQMKVANENDNEPKKKKAKYVETTKFERINRNDRDIFCFNFPKKKKYEERNS